MIVYLYLFYMDAPIVRMRRPIVHKPKPKVIPTKTLRTRGPTPKPLTRKIVPKSMPRKTMKRPSPVLSNTPIRSANRLYDPKHPSPVLSNTPMRSANRLYDPKHPSPVKIDSDKLFRKMEELQHMLTKLMKKRSRPRLSMNRSAQAYLNAASYDDPLNDAVEDLKLKGIKGPSLG